MRARSSAATVSAIRCCGTRLRLTVVTAPPRASSSRSRHQEHRRHQAAMSPTMAPSLATRPHQRQTSNTYKDCNIVSTVDFSMGEAATALRGDLRDLVREHVPAGFLGAFTDDPADLAAAQRF